MEQYYGRWAATNIDMKVWAMELNWIVAVVVLLFYFLPFTEQVTSSFLIVLSLINHHHCHLYHSSWIRIHLHPQNNPIDISLHSVDRHYFYKASSSPASITLITIITIITIIIYQYQNHQCSQKKSWLSSFQKYLHPYLHYHSIHRDDDQLIMCRRALLIIHWPRLTGNTLTWSGKRVNTQTRWLNHHYRHYWNQYHYIVEVYPPHQTSTTLCIK